MIKADLIDAVKNIPYPNAGKNVYYEFSSADGFAFLGTAKAKLGLDYEREYQAILERKLRLNGKNQIRGHSMSADASYVYTLWTCCEFFNAIGKSRELEQLDVMVESIGTYQNGWQRYSDEECYLIVPNVTSASALVKAMVGRDEAAEDMVDVLRRNQRKNGNWDYLVLDKNLNIAREYKQEDDYHLAMIIYHLWKVEYFCGVYTEDVRKKALPLIKLHPGSIGWGYPMELLALHGWDESKEEKLLSLTTDYLSHKNFRVRGISAFALSEIINE